MQCIEIAGPGGPKCCAVAAPGPATGAGEVLIEVHAAGVNRPDVLQRQGGYPPPPGASDIPGLEVAGRGRGARRREPRALRVGDPVCALVAGGGYAEFAPRRSRNACRCRTGFTIIEAAAHSRDLLHRLAQRLRARRPEAGREVAGAWRHVRHRHDGDPAGQGLRRARHRDRRSAREMRGLRGARRRARRSTTGPRISSRSSRRSPTARASTSSSTWWAATTSRATRGARRRGPARPDRAARRREGRGRLSPLMLKRLTQTGSTLRARSVEVKAAIAAALEGRSGRCSPGARCSRSSTRSCRWTRPATRTGGWRRARISARSSSTPGRADADRAPKRAPIAADGYLDIRRASFLLRPATCSVTRTDELVAAFDPTGRHGLRHPRPGRAQDRLLPRLRRPIRCFFEEEAFDAAGRLAVEKPPGINKIGHALHDLDPVFDAFSRSPALAERRRRARDRASPCCCSRCTSSSSRDIGGEVPATRTAPSSYRAQSASASGSRSRTRRSRTAASGPSPAATAAARARFVRDGWRPAAAGTAGRHTLADVGRRGAAAGGRRHV